MKYAWIQKKLLTEKCATWREKRRRWTVIVRWTHKESWLQKLYCWLKCIIFLDLYLDHRVCDVDGKVCDVDYSCSEVPENCWLAHTLHWVTCWLTLYSAHSQYLNVALLMHAQAPYIMLWKVISIWLHNFSKRHLLQMTKSFIHVPPSLFYRYAGMMWCMYIQTMRYFNPIT